MPLLLLVMMMELNFLCGTFAQTGLVRVDLVARPPFYVPENGIDQAPV
jgi:hypothetical protein